MQDDLLTIQEAAQFFGVSPRTLRRWEEKGAIKPLRTVGNQRRYSKQHLANLFKTPERVEAPQPAFSQPTQLPRPSHYQEKPEPKNEPSAIRALLGGTIVGILFLGVVILGITTIPQVGSGFQSVAGWLSAPEQKNNLAQTSKNQVLGANDQTPLFMLRVNVPSIFSKKLTLLDSLEIKNQLTVSKISNLNGGIKTNNKDIDAGKGKLTASNVVYSLLSGANISISGDPQRPTISAIGGVSSVQGLTGDLTLTPGAGISLNGLQVGNTGVLALQGESGEVTLTGGTGIGISGTTFTNTDPGSGQNIFKTITAGGTDIAASSNTDQLTFAAGSGITLVGDANTKTVTITSNAAGVLTGMTVDGVLYATSATTATSTDAGTIGYILKSNGPGVAPTWEAPGTTLGFVPFNQITSGTNTIAAMIVGSGASIGFTGTGTINASTLNGATFASPGPIGSTTAGTGAFTTLTGSTFNGLTVTSNGSNTLTIASGKTVTVSNTLTLAGTDGTTFTYPSTSGTVVTTDATQTLTNKTIAAGSNTITGLTNANLSGTAGITNANLANSSITVTTAAGSGLSGGAAVSLGGSVSLTNTGVKSATGGTGITIDQATGDITITNNGVTSLTGTLNQVNVSASTGGVTLSLPQNIHIGATPTFAGLTLSGLTTNGGLLYTNGSGTFTQTGAGTSGTVLHGGTTPSYGQVALGSEVSGTLTVGNGGTGVGSFTTNGVLYGGSTLGSTTPGTNGQLFVGNTGAAPSFVTLGGDATVNSGTGVLTLKNTGPGAGSLGTTAAQTPVLTLDAQGRVVSVTNTAIALDAAAITSGTLPINRGGTNGTATPTAGAIAYGTGTSYAFTIAGSNGDCLLSGGAGTPTWGTCAGANYLQRNGTTLSPAAAGDSLLLADSGTTSSYRLEVNGKQVGKALVVFNETGNQDIFTASASGTTKFTIANNGNLTATGTLTGLTGLTSSGSINLTGLTTDGGLLYTNGSGTVAQTATGSFGQCLSSNGGGAPTWITCAAGSNLWQSNAGTVSPFSSTLDLLVGGTSTASAKFAFYNVNSGTPTASISGASNNATSLTATGTLATTNAQSLTLGAVGTGNVVIAPGGVTALTASGANLVAAGNLTGLTGLTSGGTINLTAFTTNGGLLYTNGSGTVAQTGAGTSGTVLHGGTAPSYGQVALGSEVSGTLTIGNGGTGAGSFTSNGVVFGGATLGSTTAGTDGQILLGRTGTSPAFGTLGGDATISNTGTLTLKNTGPGAGSLGTTAAQTPVLTLDAQGRITSVSNTSIAIDAAAITSGTLPINRGGTNGTATPTAGAIAYGTGTAYAFTLAGSSNQCLLSAGAGTPVWGSCALGTNYLQRNSTTISPFTTGDSLLLADSGTTSNYRLEVNGKQTGKALVVFNETGNQDIFTASASGTTKFTIANNGNVIAAGTLAGSNFSGSSAGTNTGDVTLAGQNYLSLTGQQITANAINLSSTNVTSTLGVGNGGTGTATTFTQGSLIFAGASGIYSQNNSNFFWDNSALRLGIGTASPLASLDVRGTSGTNPAASVSATSSFVALLVDNSGSGDLFTASKSGATKFVITNAGNVGIGTTNPSTLLHLSQSNATGVTETIQNTNGGTTAFASLQVSADVAGGSLTAYSSTYATGNLGNVIALSSGTSPGGLALLTTTGAPIRFVTNNSQKMILDQSGNLGLNTSTPLATLDVRGTSGTTPVASVAGITAKAALVVDNSGVGDLFTASKSGATKFVINNAGNVGIGTTNPSGALDVNGLIINRGSNAQFTTYARDNSGNYYSLYSASGELTFYNGAIQGALSDTGQLGLGFNNNLPQAQLDVLSADFTLPGGYIHGSTGKATLVLNQTSSSGDLFTASASGTTKFTIANNGNVTAVGTIGASNFSGSSTGTNTGDITITGQNYLSLTGQQITANAINLSGTNVTSTLGVGNGGTGVNGSTAANGTLLIGNGSGYTLATITQGTGIGVSNGSGTITITNNGVTQLTGTANQVNVSGSTGSITLSLPQNIHSAATPTFASLSLTANTNQLTLGTTNTGVITMATLTSGRTYTLPDASGTFCISGQTCASSGTVGYFTRTGTNLSPANASDTLSLGTTSPLATFDVRGNSGTTPVASFSGNTSNASVILDQSGVGDIFTASKSGATKFTINNAGNVVAVGSLTASNFSGTSTGTNTGDITITGQNYLSLTGQQITANAINLSGTNVTSTLGVANGGTGTGTAFTQGSLVFAGASGVYTQNNSNFFWDNTNLRLGIGTASPLASLDVRGTSGTTPVASVAGVTAKAALVVDNSGVGDIFTASKSGATKFTINNAGNVVAVGSLTASNFSGSSTGTNTGDITITGQNYLSLTGQQITANAINLSGTNVTSTLGVGNGGTGTATAFTQGSLVFAGASGVYTQNNSNFFWDNTNLRLGIGTASPLASLDVRGTSGTTPVASIAGVTAKAAFVVDNSGVGDIFTASKSGATKFSITNSGDIRAANLASCTSLQTDAFGQFSCGSAGASNAVTFTDSTPETFNTAGGNDLWDGTQPNITPTSSGNKIMVSLYVKVTRVGTNDEVDAVQIYRNIGANATCSGTVVGNVVSSGVGGTSINGSLVATFMDSPATTSQVRYTVCDNADSNTDTGSVDNTAAEIRVGLVELAGSVGGTNYWQSANAGTVALANITDDLLIGGTATSSAKFAFLNNAGGTPVASISAGAAGALSMNATGVIGTTANQTLTLGAAGTGNIVFAPGGTTAFTAFANGRIGIGSSNPLATLDLRGNSATLPVASISGNTNFAAAVVDQSGNGDIFTASASGATRFVIANNGNVGIGTAIPLNKLGIAGNVAIGSYAGVNTAPTNGLIVSGNVGIGTNNPATALQVAGTITVNGDVLPNASPTASATSQTTTSTDTTGDVGQYTSIKIGSDGFPVIAYYDVTNTALKVMKCSNSSCSSSSTQIVDGNTGCPTGCSTSASVGQYAHIAIGTDGFPVISYYDSGNGDLKVVKCGNTSCSSSNTYTSIDTSIDSGQYNSIAIGVDGMPVISYYDNTNKDMKYAKCTTTSCSTSSTVTIDSSGTDEGKYSSIGVNPNGNVVIAYYEGGTCTGTTTCSPKVAFCFNLDCSSTILSRVDSLRNNDDNGLYVSLAFTSNSTPVLAYYDNTNHQLWSASCDDTDCATWSSVVVDTSANNIGQYTSLAMGKDNLPVISSYDSTGGDLRLDKCIFPTLDTTSGSVESHCNNNLQTSPDSTNNVGQHTSIVIGTDTLPIISYYDVTNGDLRVLKCASADCVSTSWGGYSGGSNIGSTGSFFNNIYAASYWGRSFQITAFDVAEEYAVDDASIQPGDVVRVKKDQPGADSEGRGIVIEKTDKAYDSGVLGIVSTNPAIKLGDWQDQDPSKLRPVALAGRIPVKIASDSAAITPGDYLTSSDQPGRAMKATKPGGANIGKALESWTPGSGKDTILMFASLSSGTPTSITDSNSDLGLSDKIASLSATESTTNNQSDLTNLDDRLATSSSYLNLTSKVNGLDSRIASLEANVNLLASGSALLGAQPGNFNPANAQELGLDKLDAKDVTVSNTLSVLGRTTLSDVGITGKVNIGLLNINGLDNSGSDDTQAFASINTSAGPLKLQSEGLNGIDILNGRILIDVRGNLYAKGGITVTKVNIDTKAVESASLGEGTMKAGQSKAVIETTTITDDSKIFITPKTKTSQPLSVTSQKAGDSFTVEMTTPAAQDIKFNWWIVN